MADKGDPLHLAYWRGIHTMGMLISAAFFGGLTVFAIRNSAAWFACFCTFLTTVGVAAFVVQIVMQLAEEREAK